MNSKINNCLVLFLFSVLMISCAGSSGGGGSKKSTHSSVTGWKYNDNTKSGTGLVVNFNEKLKTPPGMVNIEGGVFTIGERSEFITAERNNQRRRITVRSFYMDQFEICNLDWREYTQWMEAVFGKTAPRLVQKVEPNVNVWREELAYNEPYIEYYFTHPSYDTYPIVGITWEQASDYCIWRTDRVNELALIQAGIIDVPDFQSLQSQTDYQTIINNFVFNTQKYLLQPSYQPATGKNEKKDLYGTSRKVNMSDGILFPSFRLPTEAEWEFAAYGITAEKTGLTKENKVYPWAGTGLRNPEKGKHGELVANFVRGRGDMMGTSGNLNDAATITAPVDSYYPNDFGLYNMAGNVNEWVLDVYRATSFDDVSEYNSFRGNTYSEAAVESVDDLGNKSYLVDSLGRINKTINFGGDKRNFKDGDAMSKIETDFAMDTTGVTEFDLQYLKYDPSDILRPSINDKCRVFKGGSWKDRVYWLSPSSRRYLEQDKSANDIGFRCAMSMIGETSKPIKR